MKNLILIFFACLLIVNSITTVEGAQTKLVEIDPKDEIVFSDGNSTLIKTHNQDKYNNAISVDASVSPIQTFLVSNDCFLRKVEVKLYSNQEASSSSSSLGDIILEIVEVNSSQFKVLSSIVKNKNEIPRRVENVEPENIVFNINPGIPLKADTTYGIRLKSPDSKRDMGNDWGYEWSIFSYASPLEDKYQNGSIWFNNGNTSYESSHADAVFSIYVSTGVIALETGNPIMTVNGVKKEIDPGNGTSPIIKNGRALIPIRSLIEQLGGKITWVSEAKKLTIKLNSKTIQLLIDNKTVNINGVNKQIDVSPCIINGRTFIPLRLVGENLGCEVNWDSNEKKITIVYGNFDAIYSGNSSSKPLEVSNCVNIDFEDLSSARSQRINWYTEDGPIPYEIKQNQEWLRSKGMEITCYPKCNISLTRISSSYGDTGFMIGISNPDFTDSLPSSELKEIMTLNFIQSPIKSAEIEFASEPTKSVGNQESMLKIEAYDANNNLIKTDLFSFKGIINGVFSTKKYKFESDTKFSKLNITSSSWASKGVFICSINYNKE
ncbi:MAG: stalk domain-containing protein [Bacillota bacterium]|nr:stalk domain-containing protein [Bacillota bacterium]